ncbi:MAG: hypothetical protein ABI430_03740 [Candidatus Taylorbacteria bacterium]
MFSALIAFGVSLLVLTALILHKIWELKKGHTFISKGVLPKSDTLIQEQIDIHTEVIVGGGRRGIRALTSITKESAKHFFLVFAHYLHDKLTRIIVKLRGKGTKHKSGVSFFLKRMEGYKKDGKGGIVSNSKSRKKEQSEENDVK